MPGESDGARQISEELRGELARYQAGTQSQLARAEQERNQARMWDRWYGGRGGQTNAGCGIALALLGGVLAIATALGGGAQALLITSTPYHSPWARTPDS